MLDGIKQLHKEIQILNDNNIDTHELERIADAIEREVDSSYVELPKDESGEHIHVGDLLTADGYAGVHKAIYISYHHDGWVLKTDVGAIARPEAYARLYHKPTVEDVLEDYRVKYYDLVTDMECKNITNEEYVQGIKELNEMFAAKLQLREAE